MISALLLAVIPALLLPWVLIPLKSRLLFAVLPVLPLALVYSKLIAARRTGMAVAAALLWAVAISVSTIGASAAFTEGAMKSIWHAAGFRDEMVRWVATGQGPEGNIAQFLPRVLLEYALVLALSAVSVGGAALLLGGLLLGYMNGYVGWVVAHSDPAVHPWLAALTAWPPWSVCRVVSFILAGTAAALWGFPRILRRGTPRAPIGRLLVGSVLL
ncbi:MAG TPA: hypothetical protein VFP58_05470, partial [Candidatus Eisenbacteria bacterium]|nr:hypothetical protein [Candidatus Eisenbacteria bacterium]